jgi:hypothetical protein
LFDFIDVYNTILQFLIKLKKEQYSSIEPHSVLYILHRLYYHFISVVQD